MTGTGDRPLAALPDDELVRRYQEGTDPEEALLELYERHRTVTYGFFRRRIGIPEVAAEENQELYLTVVRYLKDFRGESSFRTWLFQIAHNRLSRLRHRWSVRVDERTEDVPDDLLQAVRSETADPEREAGTSQVARVLRRCIAALPEIERAVVFGQYYVGITLRELTEEMKLTNKSGARSFLIAAQRRLKTCLARAGVDSGTVDGLGGAS
jgi:RNA polymerase sigma-70 factor (ECF subfamily)